MNIIITGGNGYLGRAIIQDMLVEDKILVVDNKRENIYRWFRDRLNNVHYSLYDTQISNFAYIRDERLQETDIVIHLAAIVDATKSKEQEDEIKEVNYTDTIEFFRRCAKNKVRVIIPSSTSVYGTSDHEIVFEDDPSVINPQSTYAEYKYKMEQAITEIDDLDYVMFRFGTVCGVSRGIRFQTAVNKFCKNAFYNEPLTVWKGHRDIVRPYLALYDLRKTIKYTIRNWEQLSRQTFNILSANLSVNDILDIIKNHIRYIKVNEVNSPILNHFSYKVSNQKWTAKTGIRSCGKAAVEREIDEIFTMFKGEW